MMHALVLVALVVLAQARPLSPRKTLHLKMSRPLGLKQVGTSSAEATLEPYFTEETMPPVSPALQCVMGLTMQYFIIYTSLAIIRTVNELCDFDFIGVQNILETACTTVTYAPMLSVLFLGARMFAIQLSQGETEKYKLPQPWVQWAMFSCMYAVLGQVILVLLIPIFTHEYKEAFDEHGHLDMSKVQTGGVAAAVFSAFRYIIMIGLYGGFTTVIVGIFMMKGPKEVWGHKTPRVAPAVLSTVILTTLFFFVYLLVALCKTTVELRGRSAFIERLEASLVLARHTVSFAPMLAILFIAARMRALQIDPKHGNPQSWAQMCFFICTGSVALQMLLVIMMPFCTHCECKEIDSEGGDQDVVFVMEHKGAAMCFDWIRYLCLLALYGGFTAVIVSVFLIAHPTDVSKTPPISPAMQCVMNLTLQYFTVYLMLFISITIRQHTDMEFLKTTINICDGAQKTVMCAPMLAILFIGARMRALQLTRAGDGTIPPDAGPQPWAQDGMFLATWSLLVQLAMTILVPICTGTRKSEMDQLGRVPTPEGAHLHVGYAIETVRYCCLLATYGGILAVMAGIYMMTPETLPPYSHDGQLIAGLEVPAPPAPPTKAEMH